MEVRRIEKQSFVLIGKEGSTDDGEGFVQALWLEASSNFAEIAHLAKRNSNGSFAGFWGAMTAPSRSFAPWEDNYSKGLYLAGAECVADARPPEGWTRWVVPGFEYVVFERAGEGDDTFKEGLKYLEDNGLKLVGAQQDFVDPGNGKNYLYFPIRLL